MSTHAQIETLRQQLSQVKSDLAETKRRSRETRLQVLGAKLRTWYFRGCLALRKPAPHYSMWDAGVLSVGPLVAMIVAFIAFSMLGLPGGLLFWLLVLAGVVAFAILSIMLGYPSTATLPKLIADERFLADELRGRLHQIKLETNTLQKQVVATRSALDELLESDRKKRESLLAKNWKAMLQDAWRRYVEEVFIALGGDVERPEEAPDVDTVVIYGDVRIAVLTKANVAAVTSKDVEQVLAAKSRLKCDRAAILTNHRLARSAEDLAEANGVFLIDMQQIPSFVMGSNLELFK